MLALSLKFDSYLKRKDYHVFADETVVLFGFSAYYLNLLSAFTLQVPDDK